MERREALGALAGLVAAVAGSNSLAADHDHHHHHGGGKYDALVASTADCVAKGEACLAHCLVLLGNGDREMAECAMSVNQMLAACRALQSMATQSSRLTGAMAKLALDACTECEKNCKKHADKHAECKACMESCAECIKQCKAASA